MTEIPVSVLPPVHAILGGSIDAEEQLIQIAFLADDRNSYLLQAPAALVPQLVAFAAALSASLGEAGDPSDERSLRPLQAEAVHAALRDDGAPAVVVDLGNGLELAIEMPRGDFAQLAREFEELAILANRRRQH